jgi:hypothetical protein
MDRKTFTGEIKQVGEAGEFEAVIATFGVIDHDGDIVEHGAFDGFAGASIMSAHDQQSVPLGKVRKVEERGEEAVALGKFNRDVTAGKDWHEALKFDMQEGAPVQEWSWGYRPKGADGFRLDTVDERPVRRLLKLDIEEFSPVLRGASLGTRTLAVKSAEKCETSDAPWDAGAIAVARFKADDGSWPGAMTPHHFPDGKASTRACTALIVALNQTPEEPGRKEFYDHLAAHLKDAGIEPPELRDTPGVRLSDQVKLVTWQAESAALRLTEVAGKTNGGLSDAVKAEAIEMATAVDEMTRVSAKLADMVDQLSPEDEVALAWAGYMASEARRRLTDRE